VAEGYDAIRHDRDLEREGRAPVLSRSPARDVERDFHGRDQLRYRLINPIMIVHVRSVEKKGADPLAVAAWLRR